MLDNRLAASKRPRNCRHSSFCNREEGIDYPLSCDKRHLRRKFLPVRASSSNWPFLHHRQFFCSLIRIDDRNHFFYREDSSSDLTHRAFHSPRHHDLLLHKNRFLYRSDHISRFHLISRLCQRYEFPFQIPFQRRYFDSSLQIVSGNLHNVVQRSLYSVINTCDQSGAEFYRHRNSHGFHRFSRTKS